MGRGRFKQLLDLLPATATVVGIDEHTALVMDLATAACRVMGRGNVTLLRAGEESLYRTGRSFPVDLLGPFRPIAPEEGISPESWEAALAAAEQRAEAGAEPTSQVMALVRAREEARLHHNWPAADTLREQIADLGWRVLDTPQGPLLEPLALGS